jgi:hypothetical protein
MTEKKQTDCLEGILLKQGGKTLKAWRKRQFRSDPEKPLLYHYEVGGKHMKGALDLTGVTSVQPIEGRISIRFVYTGPGLTVTLKLPPFAHHYHRGDTQKYFPFELVRSNTATSSTTDPKNVRLAAATREELEYWVKGIEAMLKNQGTSVSTL